jgi:heat-inducible transcriptional repressor
MLSPRMEKILKSVVMQYVEKAVPVPSQSLLSDPDLKVCSATIRNDMVCLEREGYIIRPYTSSGSVPTDKGYRYYVESLSDFGLPVTERRLISHLFHQVERRLEEWLNLTASVVAQMSQNVSLVTLPKPADCKLKHLELVAIQDALALMIIVLRGAKLRQQLITFERAVIQEELEIIGKKLNDVFSGLGFADIKAKEVELSPEEKQVIDCLVEIMRSEEEMEYDEPRLDGLHFALTQPEFAQNPRMAKLVELVEKRNLLKVVLPRNLGNEGVQVIIGEENESEIVRDYSVVIGRYGLPSKVVGAIGVVGPTRMQYARAISVVAYLSVILSELVGELYERGAITE